MGAPTAMRLRRVNCKKSYTGDEGQQKAEKDSERQQRAVKISVSLTARRGRHNRRPAANPVHSQLKDRGEQKKTGKCSKKQWRRRALFHR